MKTTCLLLISLVIFSYGQPAVHAQADATGQICVRAFEDANANQIRDQAEVPIQADIIANLLDHEGVIIASQLIEDSPTRSQGLICFRDLAPSNYAISITTAAYLPTTADQMTVTLVEGDLPVVMDFGGQALITPSLPERDPNTPTLDPTLERLIVASIGALIAIGVWVMLGGVILLAIVRPRKGQAEAVDPTDPNALFKPPPPSDETYEL